MKGIKVASFFDGMSCGQIAFKDMGVKVDQYFASEIDKFAIHQTQLNFPGTKQLGSITDVNMKDVGPVDLVIGGSPCQGFSFAGKRLNFDDPRSALFFEFIRVLKEAKQMNPNVKFLLENVNMKREHLRVISEHIGIYPVRINSRIVSAQNRDRWYWTNIKTKEVGLFKELWSDIPQPKDRKIFLKDILQDESEVDEKYFLSQKIIDGFLNKKSEFVTRFNPGGVDVNGKCPTITSRYYKQAITDPYIRGVLKFGRTDEAKAIRSENLKRGKDHTPFSKKEVTAIDLFKTGTVTTGNENILYVSEATKKGYTEVRPGECFDSEHPKYKTRRGRKMEDKSNSLMASQNSFLRYTNDCRLRRLTPTECARLQTVLSWYKWDVSDTQQYKMLGNGWTIEVIKHIFNQIKW